MCLRAKRPELKQLIKKASKTPSTVLCGLVLTIWSFTANTQVEVQAAPKQAGMTKESSEQSQPSAESTEQMLENAYVNLPADQRLFDIESPEREAQRKLFLKAERSVWKMDGEELLETVRELGDYPLVPYLLERKLSDRMRSTDAKQISAFLSLYKDTPLANKVNRKWLHYLAKRNKRDLFLEFYEPSSNATLACTYIDYSVADGSDISLFYPKIAELWTVGKSQPKQCDGIFKRWIDAGELTEDLVLQRIQKAADGGSHTLIPYLKTLLPREKQYLADLCHKTRRDPSVVRRANLFPGKYPLIEAEIMSYGLSRYIWRDQNRAIKAFRAAEDRLAFAREQQARIYGRFGIKLAIDNHKEAETFLTKASDVSDDPEVMRWHLAHLLKAQDWARIVLLIENSSPQKVSANDYSYWLARAYEQLGRLDEAEILYRQVASHRHYYGFLASARLNQPYDLENAPVNVSKAAVLSILDMPAAQRAYELRVLERWHHARLEWRHLQRQLNDEDKLATTVISSAWGWHDQSIFTFSREGYLDDVERRFPTAFADIITREASKNKIEPEWAFAIARRESSFMPDAVSPANARGLMQVLPSTAKYLEKRRVSSSQLLDVDTNAKIGNKYLRYLLDKLDDNTILATASYNAGWRRVRQWLPEKQALEADIWVELIPFKETRNYVKAVLAYKQIYRAQLEHLPLPVKGVDKRIAAAEVFKEFIETDIPVSL
jgi:soluble lytic murein transglycosylase